MQRPSNRRKVRPNLAYFDERVITPPAKSPVHLFGPSMAPPQLVETWAGPGVPKTTRRYQQKNSHIFGHALQHAKP